jgi:hypothetical protein
VGGRGGVAEEGGGEAEIATPEVEQRKTPLLGSAATVGPGVGKEFDDVSLLAA